MPMNVDGLDQLIGDINRMASALDTANEGAPAAKRILQAAAVPVDAQMKANASKDPKIISNKLHGAISTGKVKRHKSTGLHITIGVIARIGMPKTTIPPMWSMGIVVLLPHLRTRMCVRPLMPVRMKPSALSGTGFSMN